MNIKIEKIPAYRIAYIRQIGAYGFNNVRTMEKLKEWTKSNHLFNDESIILGIALNNPETTKPENCRYDTCIVVSNDYSVTDGYVREGNIVGGKYAVFKINHTCSSTNWQFNKNMLICISVSILVIPLKGLLSRIKF